MNVTVAREISFSVYKIISSCIHQRAFFNEAFMLRFPSESSVFRSFAARFRFVKEGIPTTAAISLSFT